MENKDDDDDDLRGYSQKSQMLSSIMDRSTQNFELIVHIIIQGINTFFYDFLSKISIHPTLSSVLYSWKYPTVYVSCY